MDELGVCHPVWWAMGRRDVQDSVGHVEAFSEAGQGRRDWLEPCEKIRIFILRIRNRLQDFKWRYG